MSFCEALISKCRLFLDINEKMRSSFSHIHEFIFNERRQHTICKICNTFSDFNIN
jgi:hypothetical protein